jgi:hypothetical protein
VEVVADPDRMVAFEEVFATCATSGFQSFLACEDGVGEGAAFAGLVGVTLTASLMPLVVVVLTMDAEGMATVVVPQMTHRVCSTLIVASGLVADRRLAVHADHAAAIGQTLASLTVACGKKLGESPIGSSLRPP